MQGLDLSRRYYEEYGIEMLHSQFPEYEKRIAVGLVGSGSECFGYDDDISKDHDFEPGFCLWLTDEDEELFGFRLSRAYHKLPKEYMGVKKEAGSAYGGGRLGVKRIGDFYRTYTGRKGAPERWQDWLYTPEHFLSNAVNGEVFRDELGVFTAIRNDIMYGMPEEVRLKKIAARAVLMAQSGQYNYTRCMKHKEPGAAQLALAEFVQTTASMVYLLNKKYAPYYKWMLRGMQDLAILPELAGDLELLLIEGNQEANHKQKEDRIEKIASLIIDELKKQHLTTGNWDYLEPHGFEVMKLIKDAEIRKLHVMEG